MAFGILEDHKLDNIPGTALLSDKGKQATTDEAVELKRGTGRHSHVVLVPQPSDDPHDPLNWPRWKKEACFWSLMVATGISNTIFTFSDTTYVLLAREFRVSIDEIASSFSTILIGAAICAFLQNALAVKYGHRIVYVAATFLMFISCIWTPLSADLVSIGASRVLQGVAGAPIQCLVPVTIEHLYFVHERGSRSFIWLLSESGGPILGIIINSYVTQTLSWRLGFWFASVPCGLTFIGVLFFVPETTYHRQASPAHDSTSIRYNNATGQDGPTRKLPAFLSQLTIYGGTYSNESLWKVFLRPLPFILSPVTWFLLISVSIPAAIISVVSLCSATIFTFTYGFDVTEIGLTSLSGLVGIVLAMIVGGPLGDCWIVWISQRNRGVYEPEYRLVFVLSMLFGVFGYVGWAIGNDHHMHWIGAVACLTTLYFQNIVSKGAVLGYMLDTHGANSIHVSTLMNVAGFVISYSLAFFANHVVLSAGVERTFLILGGLQAVCLLLCVPMYVYGKRVRSFIARHPRLFRRDLPDVLRSAPSSRTSGLDGSEKYSSSSGSGEKARRARSGRHDKSYDMDPSVSVSPVAALRAVAFV